MFLKTIRLRDHTSVTLRMTRPNDAALLLEMHQRLSEASLYYRYLRYRAPSFDQLAQLARMPADVGIGIVASIETPSETIIGHAYYVIVDDEPEAAEPAVLVEDQFQGRGLGPALLQALSQTAREQGIRVFSALIHPSNEQIMGLMRRSGLPFESKYAYGMREVRVQLDSDTRR